MLLVKMKALQTLKKRSKESWIDRGRRSFFLRGKSMERSLNCSRLVTVSPHLQQEERVFCGLIYLGIFYSQCKTGSLRWKKVLTLHYSFPGNTTHTHHHESLNLSLNILSLNLLKSHQYNQWQPWQEFQISIICSNFPSFSMVYKIPSKMQMHMGQYFQHCICIGKN